MSIHHFPGPGVDVLRSEDEDAHEEQNREVDVQVDLGVFVDCRRENREPREEDIEESELGIQLRDFRHTCCGGRRTGVGAASLVHHGGERNKSFKS